MKKIIIISVSVLAIILIAVGLILFFNKNKNNEVDILKAYIKDNNTLVIVSPSKKVDAKESWTISDVDATKEKKYIQEYVPCAPWREHKKEITKVIIEDEIYPVDTSFWFAGFENLETIEGIENIKTINTVSMAGMFRGCSKLKELSLSTFDTRGVESMAGMFADCINLQRIYVNEQIWSTDNVIYSDNMFKNTVSLTGGKGTVFDLNIINKEYARVDTKEIPGYLTGVVSID